MATCNARTGATMRAARMLLALLAVVAAAVWVSGARAATILVTPGKSVQAAVRSAAPGDTVSLSGTFTEDVTIERSGITLTSAPGEVATLQGRLIIWDGANGVTVSNLRLNGQNASRAPSPTVLGDRAVFRANDVTNGNTEICFILGSLARNAAAEGTVIDGNRIHNCGKLPAQNGDHGIYVEYARGTQITNNYIYDNADRGIQLYPDADGTLIANNVIDGNGEGIIFSGSGSRTSDQNVVRNNVITNSTIRYNVEYYGPRGVGNVVTQNCLWRGAQGNLDTDGIAFSASANLVVDPLYVNRPAKNYLLQPATPCKVARVGLAGPSASGVTATAAPVPAPAVTSQPASTPQPSQPAHSQPTQPAAPPQAFDLTGYWSGQTFTVSMSGTGSASGITVRFELVSSTRGNVLARQDLTIPSLTAGRSAQLTPRLPSVRLAYLRATIDPGQRIRETNEGNNVVVSR